MKVPELERLKFVHEMMVEYYKRAIENKHAVQRIAMKDEEKRLVLQRINDEPARLGEAMFQSMINFDDGIEK